MRRSLVLLCLILPTTGVRADELQTLDGKIRKGDLVSLTEKAITFQVDGKDVTLPTDNVLGVAVQSLAKAPPALPSLLVRTIDGTQLRCQAFGLKGKEADLRLFNGLSFSLPVNQLHYVLCDAEVEANRVEFERLVMQNPQQDVLRLQSRDGKAVNTFEGFLGDADPNGEFMQFKMDNDTSRVSLARVRGMLFARKPDGAPKPACRVLDVFGNVFAAATVATTADGYAVATPAGVKLALPKEFVQRFDYSMGKLSYLSDLEPLKVEESPILGELVHFRRDKNLDGGALALESRAYAKGLALHSRTVLEYDVAGFNHLRGLLGIADVIKGYAHVLVRIEGDDQPLFNEPLTNKDKPKPIDLKITGVKRLRITVDYGEDLDLGDHVIFADARVSK